MPEFIGAPPNCRPECVANSECPPLLACINRKCQNPCVQVCGINAECRVISHSAICICPVGYTGDASIQCVKETAAFEAISPCTPSPCGPNAECREQPGAGACVCMTGYFGNPYEGCHPECIVNSDCPSNRACVRNKCIDPCPGTCATNADCQVVNHSPQCSCHPGYTGDPFNQCRLQRKYNNYYFLYIFKISNDVRLSSLFVFSTRKCSFKSLPTLALWSEQSVPNI